MTDPAASAGEQDALRLLRVEHAVAEVLLDCRTSEQAFARSLDAIAGEFGWEHAGLWIEAEAGTLRCSAQWQAPGSPSSPFELASRGLALPAGRGLPGRVWATGQPAWVDDIASDADFPRSQAAAEAGLRTAVAFPLQGRSGVLAVTEVLSARPHPSDAALMATLVSIGRRVGQFVEQRRAESAVGRSEARKRAILDAALDCIITIDHAGHVVEANAAIEEIFGWTPAEAEGREMAELMVPPELREAHRAGLASIVAGEPPKLLGRRVELPAIRRDGERIPVELTITRIDVSGRPMFTGHVRDITDRVEAEAELKASRARVVQAGDDARRRIERDLHDGAQQRLVALSFALRLAENRAADDPDAGVTMLREARSDLAEALTELRELARGIHPAVLTESGLAPALGGLVRRSPVPVETAIDLPERLPAAVEAAAYYVVAEALANVARHSGANVARLWASVEAGALVFGVSDDGRGGADIAAGSGLRGLADRLAALNGTLEVLSEPGSGSTVSGSLPLTAEA